MQESHRGIPTNTDPKNELVAKTITNRLGQKSVTLSRIDDGKRFAGYPGLAGVASKIANIVPECFYYVEPFAGTAKVYQELSISRFVKPVLNDKSTFICEWLKREMNLANVTSDDFSNCIQKYDSKETVFVIDQPWFKQFYNQGFSYFDRKSVKEYDEQIINLCKTLKGKFIITTRKENTRMLNSGFNNYLVESTYVICGKYPKVLVTTNINIEDSNFTKI